MTRSDGAVNQKIQQALAATPAGHLPRTDSPEHPVDQDVVNQLAVEQYVSEYDDDISDVICGQVFERIAGMPGPVSEDIERLSQYLTEFLTDMPDDLRGIWAHALEPSIPTLDAFKEEVVRRASDLWELKMAAWLAHHDLPQYRDAFRGDEWKLVRVVRRVRTKAGLSFSAGEETIAKLETDCLTHRQVVEAYSFHTRVVTVIGTSDVTWLTD